MRKDFPRAKWRESRCGRRTAKEPEFGMRLGAHREPHQLLQIMGNFVHRLAKVTQALRIMRERLGNRKASSLRLPKGKRDGVVQTPVSKMTSQRNVVA